MPPKSLFPGESTLKAVSPLYSLVRKKAAETAMQYPRAAARQGSKPFLQQINPISLYKEIHNEQRENAALLAAKQEAAYLQQLNGAYKTIKEEGEKIAARPVSVNTWDYFREHTNTSGQAQETRQDGFFAGIGADIGKGIGYLIVPLIVLGGLWILGTRISKA